MCRWVKPNFVSGGAVPLSIYGKVTDFERYLPIVLSFVAHWCVQPYLHF